MQKLSDSINKIKSDLQQLRKNFSIDSSQETPQDVNQIKDQLQVMSKSLEELSDSNNLVMIICEQNKNQNQISTNVPNDFIVNYIDELKPIDDYLIDKYQVMKESYSKYNLILSKFEMVANSMQEKLKKNGLLL